MSHRDEFNEIHFKAKWEKVMEVLPDREKLSMIRKMAYGLDASHYTESPKLLAHLLTGTTRARIPVAKMRLKETIRDMRDIKPRKVKNDILGKRLRRRELEGSGTITKPSYAAAHGENPDELIEVRHGGGKRFLDEFLSGKKSGYRLEGTSGRGIQVHPMPPNQSESAINDRTKYYAERGSGRHFDSPAILTARIRKGDLVTANNGYEAAVVNPAHLRDVSIKPHNASSGALPYIGNKNIDDMTPIRKTVLSAREELNDIIEFGIVSVNTAKQVLRDIRSLNKGVKTVRPEGVMSQAFYITPRTSKAAIRAAKEAKMIEGDLSKNMVVVPRETSDFKQMKSDMLGYADNARVKLHLKRARMSDDPIAIGLHEHGHSTIPDSADKMLTKYQGDAIKEGGLTLGDRNWKHTIDEEYRANREVLSRIKKYGTPEEAEGYRSAAQDQIRGYRSQVFNGAVFENATKKDLKKINKTGVLPMSLKRRTLQTHPHIRKQELNSILRDLIQFTSDKVIMDRATAYHPKLGRNVLIDADVLNEEIGHRKGHKLPLEALTVRGKGTEGYSSERQRLADIRKPLIIDSKKNVIDGRHRALTMSEQGRITARAIRATAKEIERAAIIKRL